MPLQTLNNAPAAEQVLHAWRQTFEPPAADHARALGVLLDGLPLFAAGCVRDDNREVTLREVVERALAHEPAQGWRVSGTTAEGRPFLPELGRRALALGHPRPVRADECPDEDPLLHPHRNRLDPHCADALLAFARALAAVEMQSSGLLAVVAARHLHWRKRETEHGRPQPVMDWLGPLLEEACAQCLLVSALVAGKAGPEQAEVTRLVRQLIAAYDECRAAATPWPAGPLTACCALGLLMRCPRDAALVREFKERVRAWPGWDDEDAWPTRLPGAGLEDVKVRLTERVAACLGVADRRLWPRRGLEPLLEGCWPPLLSFCSNVAAEPPRPDARS
jgi:hypothetical protein